MTAKLENLILQKKMAEKLGVSVDTLLRWSTEGVNGHRLKKIKIGRRVYFCEEDVMEFVAAINQEA